jgi:hypothetical protein
MISKKYLAQIKDQLPDRDDPHERDFVNNGQCSKCGSQQLYVGKANFKNGKGYAACSNSSCESVEEIGLDREVAFCPTCDRLSGVERSVSISDKERKNLDCGHSTGWGEQKPSQTN